MHEQHFSLQRLYDISLIARELVDEYNIGRVIARPFVGENSNYTRTANRKDYSIPPPTPTLLDILTARGDTVIALGKIADIFAHQGISQSIKADGNMALFDATLTALTHAPDNSLIFTNFVDFDSQYGHRRDVAGYAHALEQFDARLPELQAAIEKDDIVILTADHGCDPTQPGSDHTREHIPVIFFGHHIKPINLGKRASFADIGQTLASYFNLLPLTHGTSFHDDIALTQHTS
jgi:phosphopentomutase